MKFTNPSNLELQNTFKTYKEANKRILIVDDDLDVLRWFQSIQKQDSPYYFHLLDDELRILEALQEGTPDMIFMDVNLTTYSGKKVADIINLTSHFKIPIVYMSSKRNANIDDTVDEDHFMLKPLSKNIIQGKIQNILKVA